MRIDRLLCFLRFVRTRGVARTLIEQGHIRHNGDRVMRTSRMVAVGDVLTIPLAGRVRLIEILSLPQRRGPAREARECYRELDPAS